MFYIVYRICARHSHTCVWCRIISTTKGYSQAVQNIFPWAEYIRLSFLNDMKTGTGKLSPRRHSLEIGTACDATVEKKRKKKGSLVSGLRGEEKVILFEKHVHQIYIKKSRKLSPAESRIYTYIFAKLHDFCSLPYVSVLLKYHKSTKASSPS